jgi:hypothetical protein
MLKHTTLELGDGLVLGPQLSEQEWHQALERHREMNVAKLRSIFRKELVVTNEQREAIQNAAHGMWKF